jgi:Rv2175c C-terminal domain of unknown function/DNA-binding protein Rv2175c, wHTH domain
MVTGVSEVTDPAEWMTLPDVAEAWGVDVTRIRQAIRDRHLVAVRIDGVLRAPRVLVGDGQEVKGLHGVLTLLADAGYTSEEAVRWLLTDDPSLPGPPALALAENRGTEVKRRAQALGF